MSTSVTTLIVSLLLVMAIFFGGYSYIEANYESAGIIDETNISRASAGLDAAKIDLSNKVDNITTAAKNINEADGNIILVAWNGLTGLAATMRLFLGIIDTSVAVWHAVMPGLAFLPDFVIILFEIALIATIVLIIIGAFKGETKT